MTDIPEGTQFDGKFFDKELPIKHFLLKAEPKDPHNTAHDEMSPGTIVFSVEEIPTNETATGLAAISAYAKGIVQKGLPPDLVRVEVTPFDIKVKAQCWLVLQLQQDAFAKNWQFSRTKLACTAKHADSGDPGQRKGFNVALRHVRDDGEVLVRPNSKPWQNHEHDCHMIFFGVAHRGATNDFNKRNGSHFFNLNIEFHQIYRGVPSVLELIIDPDVGNEGPDAFPPGP